MVSGIDGYGKGPIRPDRKSPITPLRPGASPISSILTPEEKSAVDESVNRNFGSLSPTAKDDIKALLETEIAFRKNEEEGKALGLI
jgi:hypothetical protein